jgi:hypothetical protein
MANVNYTNPAAMSPYGDWQPTGFMAGWQYKDKMADYSKVRDLSNQSQFLENMRRQAELDDYTAGADLRGLTREVGMQEARNQMGVLPILGELQKKQAHEQLITQVETQIPKIQTAMNEAYLQLGESERKKRVSELLSLASLARSMPEDADWTMLEREAKRQRLSLEGAEELDENGKVAYLTFLRRLDPEYFKAEMDMRSTRYKEDAATDRTIRQVEGQKEVAEIGARTPTGSQQKEDRLAKLQEEAFPILSKSYQVGWEGLSPEEKATLAMWMTYSREPYYQQSAGAQRDITTTESALGALGIPTQPTPAPSPLPRAGSPAPAAGPAQINPAQQQPVPQGTNQFPSVPQTPQQEEVVFINGKPMQVLIRRPDGTMRVYDPELGKLFDAKPQ